MLDMENDFMFRLELIPLLTYLHLPQAFLRNYNSHSAGQEMLHLLLKRPVSYPIPFLILAYHLDPVLFPARVPTLVV
jgi:hypothetical protein